MEISKYFLVSQLFASLAFLLGIISFQFKSRRNVLVVLSISTIANSAHFVFLGRPGPASLELVAACRQFIAGFFPLKKLMWFFLILLWISFFLTYQKPLSFLGLFAASLGTIGSFQGNEKRLRIMMMIASASWGVHNILAASPVAALMEFTIFSSNLIGYFRYHRVGLRGRIAEDQR